MIWGTHPPCPKIPCQMTYKIRYVLQNGILQLQEAMKGVGVVCRVRVRAKPSKGLPGQFFIVFNRKSRQSRLLLPLKLTLKSVSRPLLMKPLADVQTSYMEHSHELELGRQNFFH